MCLSELPCDLTQQDLNCRGFFFKDNSVITALCLTQLLSGEMLLSFIGVCLNRVYRTVCPIIK